MTNWFKKRVQMAYFPSKDSPLKKRWVRIRGVAERVGLSSKAKEKLEWVIFYHTVGGKSVKVTSCYFGITRKTLHKWLRRFEEKNLRSLEEKSRAPIRKREWEVTREEEERIVFLRKSHLKWGKKKLKRLYLKTYKETVSTWKVERVIRKWNLYPDKEKHKKYLKIKAKREEKVYIKSLEKKDSFGFLWHIDAIIIWWYGARRIIFTAMEERTKVAFARVYKTNSSNFSKDFLLRLVYLVEGRVNYIHSDKRFNWTIQDEWLSLSEVGLDSINDANRNLTSWLIEYNNLRPHETLDYQTPLEYAQEHYFKVLPMWSASTSH